MFPSSKATFDPLRNLTREDITIFPSFALVTVNWTKTLQYQGRIPTAPIPRIPGSLLCPVTALEDYFHNCQLPTATPSPLFCFPSCSTTHPFTYDMFPSILKSKLSTIGINSKLYSGHSFRRGGASFTFSLWLPKELIQKQGDWRSDVYLRYLDKLLSQRLKVAFAFKKALLRWDFIW